MQQERRLPENQENSREDAKLEFEHTVALQFDVGPKLSYSGPVVQYQGVVACYPGKRLTKAFDLSFDLNSRVSILRSSDLISCVCTRICNGGNGGSDDGSHGGSNVTSKATRQPQRHVQSGVVAASQFTK